MAMMNVRRASDGSYWIPRQDAETEAYLDSKYVRLTNQLRWVSKIPHIMDLYSNIHVDQCAHIVGKGPSLDTITRQELTDEVGPIITLNESIHKIESLDLPIATYGVQLDSDLGAICKPSKPSTRLFISPQCENLYEEGTYKVVVDPRSYFLAETCLSVQLAIELAKRFGCTRVMMHCFDGCIGNDYEYAECIGRDSGQGGSKIRFKSHKPIIIEATKGMHLSWRLGDRIIEQGIR